MVPRLGDAAVTLVDLGFLGRSADGSGDWPADAIAVGHSLGVLWLLERKPGHFKGLVSIQGFDRFCPHVPPARVAALKRGLARDPGGTMEAFWLSCGAPNFAPQEGSMSPGSMKVSIG